MDFLRFYEQFDTDNLQDYVNYINYQTDECYLYNILMDFCEDSKQVLEFFEFDNLSINDIFADFKKYSIHKEDYKNINTLTQFYKEYHE